MKHCQWCDTSFVTAISYQIYCSPECRVEATKEKIAQRYQIAKRTNRKPRKCKSCGSPLSIYNDETTCLSCDIIPDEVAKMLKEIKRIANGKSET